MVTKSAAVKAPKNNLAKLGFDAARLGRVRDAVKADIDAGRCHGVRMMVARHGEVCLICVKATPSVPPTRR